MKKTYSGSCHCGDVRFEVDADLDHVRDCDCSICKKRGALIHLGFARSLPASDPFRESDALHVSHAHSERLLLSSMRHLAFRRPRTAPEVWAVNVRCLEGVDLNTVSVKQVY